MLRISDKRNCVAISSPEFSGSSVSGGSPGRTLGTRNFYRRNRAVPVLVRMLGFDETEVITKHHEVNFSLHLFSHYTIAKGGISVKRLKLFLELKLVEYLDFYYRLTDRFRKISYLPSFSGYIRLHGWKPQLSLLEMWTERSS